MLSDKISSNIVLAYPFVLRDDAHHSKSKCLKLEWSAANHAKVNTKSITTAHTAKAEADSVSDHTDAEIARQATVDAQERDEE